MQNNLRSIRKAAGLTQARLAEAVETSQQQIQRIEAGSVVTRITLAAKLAETLGVSLADIFPEMAALIASLKAADADFEDDVRISRKLDTRFA